METDPCPGGGGDAPTSYLALQQGHCRVSPPQVLGGQLQHSRTSHTSAWAGVGCTCPAPSLGLCGARWEPHDPGWRCVGGGEFKRPLCVVSPGALGLQVLIGRPVGDGVPLELSKGRWQRNRPPLLSPLPPLLPSLHLPSFLLSFLHFQPLSRLAGDN